MAKDSEPRARPITVSELIARSETGGAAFPKSASEEDRRSVRRAGASGMPSHPPVASEPSGPTQSTSAQSTPAQSTPEPSASEQSTPEPAGPEANAVTGIIPIVRDDLDDDTAALEPVPGDDLVGVDLPAMEYRGEDPADDADDDVEAAEVAGAAGLVGAAADEPEAEHRRVASAADLDAAQEAEAQAQQQERDRAAAKKAKKAKKESSGPSALLGWLSLIGEVVLGLAVGAGLFWGFTELWKQYVYLALILAVVVIFAIVTFAHVLRKRDLPTTLLALGVGMLVTIGPLVLLAA